MRYSIDKMTLADLPRVVEIERLSYSTPWPPSAYRKELQENPTAHYIVARDTQLAPAEPPASASGSWRLFPPWPLSRAHPASPASLAAIVGFAGLWLMIDEAHVTTIAVHPEHRHRGVGERMLSALIEHAYDVGARVVSLEVRVTNTVAQTLYRKYGFREAGIRRRYYSDNDEDALIMWTDPIHSPDYRERFLQLRGDLARRLGDTGAPSRGAGGGAG